VRRRQFLASLGALAFEVRYPAVEPRRALAFPRDHGAHPDYRTEWWYLTGWLRSAGGAALGFQVTFFRARPPFDSANPSRFAPRQILLAHAALAEPAHGRLRHDERAARAALGLAGASEATTEVWIDDWRLALEGRRYETRIAAREFRLDLELEAKREPLLQGDAGFSLKGRRETEASYYYSRPRLAVWGAIERGQGREAVSGSAWLDHEWSSTLMAPEAVGWDWTGFELDDGGALMAFRMRDARGGAYYAGGTRLWADGRRRAFAPGEIAFEPQRRWRSPRTGVEYPVAMRLVAGEERWILAPLMDDQELDARASTGTIYWEGAVRALTAEAGGREAGRGYLELTGYWKPLKL
jgi:predicted secreted hydrolase